MRSPVFKNPDNENLELLEPMNYFKRNLIKSSILPALVILLLSCSREGENGSKPFFSVRIVHSGIYCDSFNWNPIPTESIMVPEPDEISGIAPSLANDGQYWLHEDKGNIPRLMLYDTLGVCKANYFLQGFEITDLEDVSLAVIEEDTLIFLGDVGDNNKSREYVKIISLSDKKTQSNASVTVSGINNYMIKYPADDAGIPIKEDCEAFCFEGEVQIIAITNKRLTDNYVVYGHSLPCRLSSKEIEQVKGVAVKVIKSLDIKWGPINLDIILTKEGSKGIYRLQWRSFAFWIKNMAMKKEVDETKTY